MASRKREQGEKGEQREKGQKGQKGEKAAGTTAAPMPGDAERARAAEEIATRLRRRGVRLSGRESGDELVRVLEAVERFEAAVERGGGNLMVDQPTDDGGDTPTEPDDRAFVLPVRTGAESIDDYLVAIGVATDRARTARSSG